MTPQDAKLALDLLTKVNIPASDEAIAAVARLRSSLHRIAAGRAVVIERPEAGQADAKPPDTAP